MALPASGTYLDSIRESSRRARLAAQISITDEAIERLLLSDSFTSSFQSVSKSQGLVMPLKFSSHLAELNVISVLSLLNFASGFRVPLHKATGRGAWDSIRALVLGMYIVSTTGEGDLLSAKGMRTVDVTKVAEFMRVNVHVEKPHADIPGITVGTLGGPMYELCKLISNVLTETGEVLVNSGYPDLGSFVAEALEEGAKVAGTKDDADVEVILERLVRAIPGFRDMAVVNDQPIYCFKKALFLINGVRVRFGSMSPPPFPIPSTNGLPIFSDNVIPSMLVHFGVIDLTSSTVFGSIFPKAGSATTVTLLLRAAGDDAVPTGQKEEGPVLSKDQSFILRGAAIDACEMIVKKARLVAEFAADRADELSWMKGIELSDLDAWLWQIAKDRIDYRKLARFVDQDTVFF